MNFESYIKEKFPSGKMPINKRGSNMYVKKYGDCHLGLCDMQQLNSNCK
ncbi:MAG: hypothetical protein KKF44_11490 [Nanoarchaeota archaeon]|nr:hypothetical protein [Nanoarchaeota archaeon]